MAAHSRPETDFDAYVSYSRRDTDWVVDLVSRLEQAGLRVYWDQGQLQPGQLWREELEAALRSAPNVIVVVSQDSMNSSSVEVELQATITRAESAGQRLIPVIYRDAEMPPALLERQWIDFRNASGPEYERKVHELIQALKIGRAPERSRAAPAVVLPVDLWERLSAQTRSAFGWAAALRAGPTGPLVDVESLQIGIVRTQLDTEPEILLRHFGRSVEELLAATRTAWPHYRLEAARPLELTEIPDVRDYVPGVMRVALDLAEATANGNQVNLAHLFGGLLRVSNPARWILERVLGDVDMADVAASYRDYLVQVTSTTYREFLAVRHPWTPVDGAPFRPERAGYASDAETRDERDDQLDFNADVLPLCHLIMAQDVRTPLSIGLFGEWGSGKSSFMRLMQRRVDAIARNAREAVGRGGHTAFCTQVVQVTFNAWHYADANLWASLALRIFETLGPSDAQSAEERRFGSEEERRRLLVRLHTQQELLKEARERRAAAADVLDATRAALPKMLQADVERSAETDVQVRIAEDRIRSELGLDEVRPEDVETVATQLRGLPALLRTAWRLLRQPRGLAGLALALVLAAAVAAAIDALASSGLIAGAVAALVALGGLVAWPLALARSLAAAVIRGAQRIDQARRDSARARIAAEADLERQVRETEREIEEIEAGRRLRTFIERRSRSSDYLSHLGLISLIRRDFEQLSRLLEDNRLARLKGEMPPDDSVPEIERVILYIDDLDRCPAAKVVQVLEAVHLLLALDIFVVVVGVDPRWLLRSLEHHHATQMSEGTAVSQSYLEKIFQIPFALRAMDAAGYRALVAHLLPVRPEEDDQSLTEGRTGELPPSPIDVGRARPPDEVEPDPTLAPPPLDPDPESLRVHRHELEFAQTLSPLVTTPRAAKRLLNTYRLIRASLNQADLAALLRQEPPGEYYVVLMLLALLIGNPSAFITIADRVRVEDPHLNFWALRPPIDADPWWDLLMRFRASGNPELPLARVERWLTVVARYSFWAGRQGL